MLSDTFTTSVFEESFNGLFYAYVPYNEMTETKADDEADEKEVLAMCFNGEIKVFFSLKPCKDS